MVVTGPEHTISPAMFEIPCAATLPDGTAETWHDLEYLLWSVRPLKSPKKLSLANFRIPDRGPGLASNHHVNFHNQTARKLKYPGSCGFTGQNILRWETLRRLLGLQLQK